MNNVNDNKRNDSFFAVGGKIYNYSLDFLYDYAANDYTDVLWMNNAVILSKVVDAKIVYFRYDTSMISPAQITISSTNFVEVSGSKYIYAIAGTLNDKTFYTYYNDGGELVNGFPTSSQMTRVAQNEKKQMFFYSATVHDSLTDSDIVHYYRLA